jgi:hypothetical protein
MVRLLFLSLNLMLSASITGQIFTEQLGQPFIGVYNAGTGFADIDNDGDLDIAISGEINQVPTGVKFYLNDGAGNYVIDTLQTLTGDGVSKLIFSDVDGDNDEDLFVAGCLASTLYLNNGSGLFTPDETSTFRRVICQNVIPENPIFIDYDNDGDLDIRYHVFRSDSNNIRRIYSNDGFGTFTETLLPSLPFRSTVPLLEVPFFYDFDEDGDVDVLVRNTSDGESTARDSLYLNDGSGVFDNELTYTFRKLKAQTYDFVDIDEDCNIDLVNMGIDSTNFEAVYVYKSQGNNIFSEFSENALRPTFFGGLEFSDVDLDGDPDAITNGFSLLDGYSGLFLNNGSGIFAEQESSGLTPMIFSTVNLGDVDGDRDPDLLFTGFGPFNIPTTILYINNTNPPLPLGNNCSAAMIIDSLFGQSVNETLTSSAFDNYLATSQDSDPDFGLECFSETNGPKLYRTLWYQFTGDGLSYRIRTQACNPLICLNNADTQLALYSGNECSALNTVICNDQAASAGGGEHYAEIEFVSELGQIYHLLVDGADKSHGEFCLQITRTGEVYTFDPNFRAISVFPNPTTGQVSLRGATAHRIDVYDHTGRLVATQLDRSNEVDLVGFAAGVYLLKIHSDERVYSAKVVKE